MTIYGLVLIKFETTSDSRTLIILIVQRTEVVNNKPTPFFLGNDIVRACTTGLDINRHEVAVESLQAGSETVLG